MQFDIPRETSACLRHSHCKLFCEVDKRSQKYQFGVRSFIHSYTHTYIRTHTYTHTYTHTQYTHIHTYTHTRVDSSLWRRTYEGGGGKAPGIFNLHMDLSNQLHLVQGVTFEGWRSPTSVDRRREVWDKTTSLNWFLLVSNTTLANTHPPTHSDCTWAQTVSDRTNTGSACLRLHNVTFPVLCHPMQVEALTRCDPPPKQSCDTFTFRASESNSGQKLFVNIFKIRHSIIMPLTFNSAPMLKQWHTDRVQASRTSQTTTTNTMETYGVTRQITWHLPDRVHAFTSCACTVTKCHVICTVSALHLSAG
jgi:hypothetical protein